MAQPISFRLLVTREMARRRATDDTLREHLIYIASRGLSGNRGRGWVYEIGPISVVKTYSLADNQRDMWVVSSYIHFSRKPGASIIPPDRLSDLIEDITEWCSATGFSKRYAGCPWKVTTPNKPTTKRSTLNTLNHIVDDYLDDPLASSDYEQSDGSDIGLYTPLSTIRSIQPSNYFSHLYGLESQIEILLSSVQAAADSDMHNRFHSLLYGFPGCGKTEILQSVARLLESLNVNHILLDATSTTEAGMRQSLLNKDVDTPDLILIEEVEKVPDVSLRWLLGIMDVRASISVANYRRTATRKVPALILATANDMVQLKRMMYGALHSRFQHEIYCPRPSRGVLAMILEREVKRVNGNLSWIEPALQFCYNDHSITDPRKVIPVCLCGKDKLLTGEYQAHLSKVMQPNATSRDDDYNVLNEV